MAVRRLDLIITSNSTAAIRGFLNLGGAAQAAERRFGGLAGAATKAFTGAAAAAGVFAVASAKSYIAFDDQMNKSLAIMGEVSGSMRNRMEAAAKSVATTTRFSADEAAAAYYDLASAGLTAEQSVAALPAVAQFAQAGMMDLTKAGEVLAGAQSALGLKTDDATQNLKNMTRVSDVLTHANNIALGTVEDFAEALSNKAAGALRANNKSLEEGVAVLAAFAQQGVTGATAGEKLAIVLRDVPRAAKRNAEEFAKFGISVFDANGNLKNMADVVAEFEKGLGGMSDGQKAAAYESLGLTRSVGDILRVLSGTSGQIREFQTELESAGGATKRVSDNQMESLAAKLDVLKNKFHNLMITVGEPIAIWFVDTLIPWIENTGIPAIETFAGAIATVAAPVMDDGPVQDFALAYGALLAAFHGTPIAVAVATSGVSTLGTALHGLNTIFLAPVISSFGGLIHILTTTLPAAIGRAAASLVLGSQFSAFASGLGLIASAFSGLWAAIAPLLIPIGVIVAAVAVLAGLTAIVAKYWGEWWTVLVIFLGPIGVAAFILGGIIAHLDTIKAFGSTVWDKIKEGADAFADAVSGAWAEVSPILTNVKNAVTERVTNVLNSMKDAAATAFTAVTDAASSAWTAISPHLVNIRDGAKDVGTAGFDFMKERASQAYGILSEGASIAWNEGLYPVFESLKGYMRDALVPAFRDLKDAGSVAFDSLSQAAGTAWGAISLVIDFAWRNVIYPVWEAIRSFAEDTLVPLFGELKDAVREAWGRIKDAVVQAWNEGIKPVWDEIKRFVEETLVPTFNALRDALSDAWTQVKQAVLDAWHTAIKPIWDAIKIFIDETLIPTFNRFRDAAVTVWHNIKDELAVAWEEIKRVLDPFMGALDDLGVDFDTLKQTVVVVWAIIGLAILGAIRAATFPLQALALLIQALSWTFQIMRGNVQIAMQAIAWIISAVWNNIIKPTFDQVQLRLTVLGWAWGVFRDVVSGVWHHIKGAISGAWTFIRDSVFTPVINFLRNVLGVAFEQIGGRIRRVFDYVKSAIKGIWDGIIGFLKGAINSAIGLVNKLIGGINTVLGLIPGLGSLRVPTITPLETGGTTPAKAAKQSLFAKGGIPSSEVGSGFITNGPRAIVGEGSKIHPEFVIPTDPKYRDRALSLFERLGGRLMQDGGELLGTGSGRSGGGGGGGGHVGTGGGGLQIAPGSRGYMGLVEPFASKVANVVRQGQGAVSIVSAVRSTAKQAELYRRYLAGTGNLAARPGTSKHERGLAVDFGGNQSLYQRLARAQGLHFPVRGEPWHAELPGDSNADILGNIVSGAIMAAWNAATAGVDGLIDQVPWKPARGILRHYKQKFGEWVAQKDAENAPASDGGMPGGGMTPGNSGIEQWRSTAAQALALTGSPSWWINSLLRRMAQESGGNPRAINNWDSNAAKGTPSKGLMQTIDSTFNAYAGAWRSRGVWDPLANIIASINYAKARYGSGPAGWDRKGGYQYGGIVSGDQLAQVHDEEMVLPRHLSRFVQKAAAAQSTGSGGATVHIENITINANTEEGGKAAARGFMSEIQRRRIMVDARLD